MRDVISGLVDLERGAPMSLYRQLYDQLRRAILAGNLPAGTRLPASRVMAQQLGVGRNTVMAAVDQLVAEGYVETRTGRGTMVARRLSEQLTGAARAPRASRPPTHRLSMAGKALASVRRDAVSASSPVPFLPSIPDLRAFPQDIWARLLRRAGRRLSPEEAGYVWTHGLPRLREAVADHLRAVRGVKAEGGQVIIVSSAQAGLDIIARALLDPGEAAWIEEPGYLGARAALLGAGARVLPVPVDAEGLAPDAGSGTPRVIYVTPSHQYPTGTLMPLARRLELLDFAARTDAYVIEDDFDSEFQFNGRPVAALQGLEPEGRVLYVGTFSKVLQPAIRVGYVVAPLPLVEPLVRIQRNTGQIVPAVVQSALAEFIEDGHMRAHVRRMCALYSERQEQLVRILRERCRDRLAVHRPAGGMQLVAELSDGTNDVALAEALARRGVVVRPLGAFYIGRADRSGLLLGYAGYPEADMDRAAEVMASVLSAPER